MGVSLGSALFKRRRKSPIVSRVSPCLAPEYLDVVKNFGLGILAQNIDLPINALALEQLD